MIDENLHDRIADLGCVLRQDDNASVAGQILMPSNAAEHQTEINARLDLRARQNLDGLEANVIRIFERRHTAAAIKGDIELARQAGGRAIIQNMEMPFARIGPRVEQFMRPDAGCRVARDIADIVGARAARAKAEIQNALRAHPSHVSRRLRGSEDWRAS